MTSYRTGQIIRYEPAGNTDGTTPEPPTYAQAPGGPPGQDAARRRARGVASGGGAVGLPDDRQPVRQLLAPRRGRAGLKFCTVLSLVASPSSLTRD